MVRVSISEAEKRYILEGVKEDIRVDGRERKDVRPLVLETGIITHASGSARVRLANTDILVGVKAELGAEEAEGRIEFFVDCSANASPEFEGRGGEDLASEISSCLSKAYSDQRVFDLSPLRVLKGRYCWILYVDVLILEVGGGSLFDVASIAAKSALFSAKIPRVNIVDVDGGVPELELSDDPDDRFRCDVSKAPILITAQRVGHHCILDATPDEEACSLAGLVIAVTPEGKISSLRKIGSGSFHPDSLDDAIDMAKEVGIEINAALFRKLMEDEKLENKKNDLGFLRD